MHAWGGLVSTLLPGKYIPAILINSSSYYSVIINSLAMKLLIAVALLVVGLSPSPGFSQFGESSGQTTEALTDATTESDSKSLTA